ncbi:MAG: hypothetical protein EBR32_03075 [Bacteroidetes bacterium]|nr:hypothetical protein [Bacteroidota bacterium]
MLISKWIGLKKHLIVLLLLSTGLYYNSKANEITISNISLANHDEVAATVEVVFDITWQNSWRNDVSTGMPNWDAAWIFGRFSIRGDSVWQRMVIDDNGYTIGTGTPANLTLKPHPSISPQGIGLLLHRSEVGYGTFTQTGVRFVWDYSVDEPPSLSNFDLLDIKLFAVEMVYIPGGPFYLGSGIDDPAAESFYDSSSPTNSPYRLETDAPFTIGPSAELSVVGINSPINIVAGFPTGIQPFYIMKHELSQALMSGYFSTLNAGMNSNYVFNALELAQQNDVGRTANFFTQTFETFGLDTVYSYQSSRENYPVAYMSWEDAAAFADWAGLRPASELEFEKAARGFSYPAVVNEYPWGTEQIVDDGYLIYYNVGSGIDHEITGGYSSNILTGNAIYSSTLANPWSLRVGIFATSTSSRAQANASATGVLDLAGNVAERTADTKFSSGLAWFNEHGDGILYTNGLANQQWPGFNTQDLYVKNTSSVSGLRGGGILDNAALLRISDRSRARNDNTRTVESGFRAALSVSCSLPTLGSYTHSVTEQADVIKLQLIAANSAEELWVIEGPAKIVSGQGTKNLVLLRTGTGSITAYAHATSECGISLKSVQISVP